MDDVFELIAEVCLAIGEANPKVGCAIFILIGLGVAAYFIWFN